MKRKLGLAAALAWMMGLFGCSSTQFRVGLEPYCDEQSMEFKGGMEEEDCHRAYARAELKLR